MSATRSVSAAGLRQLSETVEFLELAIVFAHPGGREADVSLRHSLETPHGRERTTVPNRGYGQLVQDGAVGEAVHALRKVLEDPRSDVTAPADDDVGAERCQSFSSASEASAITVKPSVFASCMT